eukprot:1153944-Pleurochrysis_carterae.AAC.2
MGPAGGSIAILKQMRERHQICCLGINYESQVWKDYVASNRRFVNARCPSGRPCWPHVVRNTRVGAGAHQVAAARLHHAVVLIRSARGLPKREQGKREWVE